MNAYLKDNYLKIFSFFFLFALIYFFRPTLSSYGIVINSLIGENPGLYFFKPNLFRSDEYSVLTPLIQLSVLSNYNLISPSIFHESLKTVFAVPIFDWGLIFKPQYFFFFIFNESIGYSFYWVFFITIFIYGWHLFFRNIFNLPLRYSLIFSLILYLNPFIQYWFTTHGQSLAFAPFVFVLLFNFKANFLKYLFLSYVTACLFISDFYPPYFLTYVFIGLMIILIKYKVVIKNLFPFLLNCFFILLGSVISIIYLWDIILLLNSKSYVNKHYVGGNELLIRYLSQLFLNLNYYKNFTLHPVNPNEFGSIGGVIPLYVFLKLINLNFLKKYWYLFVFFICISIWQIGPFSDLFNFLFYKLSPSRSFLLSGFILLILAALLISNDRDNFKKFTNYFNFRELLFFFLMVLFISLKFYLYDFKSIHNDLKYFSFFLFLYTALFFLRKRIKFLDKFDNLVLLLIFYLPFISINPIQKSDNLFNLKDHHLVKKFNLLNSKNDIVYDSLMPGGVLSGLGLNSITHVIPVPENNLKIFDILFPYSHLPDLKKYELIDKWLHIRLDHNSTGARTSYGDAITISSKDFKYTPIYFKTKDFESLNLDNMFKVSNSFELHGNCISGWYNFDFKNIYPNDIFYSYSPKSSNLISMKYTQRWDVNRHFNNFSGAFNGFDFCFDVLPNKLFFFHQRQFTSVELTDE